MQTFLPYSDFVKIAECLDNKRLGKQRVETYQILLTILEKRKSWSNHPAVNMWRGYEGCLIRYGLVMCAEWRKRGFKDTTGKKIFDLKKKYGLYNINEPSWLFRSDIQNSHRSNLLRKFPEHYNKFNWNISPEIKYIWPK